MASNVEVGLKVFEQVRKRRGEAIQQSASTIRKSLQLSDGPEQQKRDEAFRSAGCGIGSNPDLGAGLKWQDFMWGVDVMKATIEDWDEHISKSKESCLHDLSASLRANSRSDNETSENSLSMPNLKGVSR